MRLFLTIWLGVTLAVSAGACGGDDDDGGGGDAGPQVDGGPDDPDGGDDFTRLCDPPGTSDRLLPYDVGDEWEYRITDLQSGLQTIKGQSVDEEMEHPEYGTVIVQTTEKTNGRTVTLSRIEGEAVVRLEQADYDGAGALERTTRYEPFRIRLDESAERTADGASWTEEYTEVVLDAAGTEVARVPTVEEWMVIGADVECSAPIGALRCLHVRRDTTTGGVAQKEFWFARGVGKVRETGGQTEELTGCALK
jgi:hypothetical protein